MSRTAKYEKPKDSWTVWCREQVKKERKANSAKMKDQLKRKEWER